MKHVQFSSLPNMAAVFSSGVWRAGLLQAKRLGGQKPRLTSGNASLPQIRYVAPSIKIDAKQLARYAKLVGFDTSDHVPATYLHILTFPLATALMTHKYFPLALPGMVHISQQITQHSQVRVDEDLAVHVWATNMAWHHRGTSVDINSEIMDRYGTVVYSSVARYLAKGPHPPGGGEIATPRKPLTDMPPLAGIFEMDVHKSRAYAGISSDYNPIHLSRLSAMAFGFPRTIAHGMYTASRVLASLGPLVPDTFDWQFDFGKPILLPTSVNFGVDGVEGGRDAGSDASTDLSFAVWTGKVHHPGGPLAEPIVHMRGSLKSR